MLPLASCASSDEKIGNQINGSYESCNVDDNLSESSVRLGDLSLVGNKLS